MGKQLLVSFILEDEADKDRIEKDYDLAIRDRHYRSIDNISGMYYHMLDGDAEKFNVKFMRVVDLDTLENGIVLIRENLNNTYGLCVDERDFSEDGYITVDTLGFSSSYDNDNEYYCVAFELNNKIIGFNGCDADGVADIDDENIKYTFNKMGKTFDLFIEADNDYRVAENCSDLDVLHSFWINLRKNERLTGIDIVG
jgi:hypothetical protein